MTIPTRRLRVSEFGHTSGGHDRVNLQMHSEAVIEFGDALGGHDRARLEENMEAVDWRQAGC